MKPAPVAMAAAGHKPDSGGLAGLNVKFRDNRGMIGRLFEPAGVRVDPAAFAARGQVRAGKDMVYTQPAVATERGGTIVPPGITFFGLWKQAETIGKAGLNQREKLLTLGLTAKHFAPPFVRVVYILVRRGDIEVPQ